ncbi:MAG TPA: hypothetical protein VFQ53_26065 [Kofleriaceae bacterium]|nr:hypothetical protein [Kofleriaceae bacterium]
MRWIVLASASALFVFGACGGPKIPTHAGYKNDKVKPWKSAKAIKLDDKNEGKVEGDLSYPEMRRAKWYAINLPTHGELSLKLEITPPGDATNDDFDLALEVLDPHFRVISKSDLEDEDAHELNKQKQLVDLEPGKYLVHLYLQGRLDTADYILRVAYRSTTPPELKTDFPAQVAFVPNLPMVPLKDDTPEKWKPTTTTTVVRKPVKTVKPPPTTDKPPAVTLTARIVGVSVVSGGTKITVGRGTNTGAMSGMKAKLNGISGAFPIDCNENTCTATISATPDQVRGAGGSATLVP